MPPNRYATSKDFANLGFLPSPGIGSGGSIMDGTLFTGNSFGLKPSLPTIGEQLNKANNLASANIAPQNRITELKAAYDRGEIPFEKLFEKFQMDESKYPEVSAQTGKAFGDIATTDKGVGTLNFDDLKKQFAGANNEMNSRYNEFQQSNDIGDYAARQRALDAEAKGLTGEYTNIGRGQMADAEGAVNRYRTEGQGAVNRYTANAEDFYNKDIPAAIKFAQDKATAYTSRYGLGRGGGLGSDIGRIAGRSAINAALPYQLQGRQYMGTAYDNELRFAGDVGARDYNRITGFNAPMEQSIYGSRHLDVMRSKGTEQQIQNLDMLVKERGLQAAVQNLRNQGIAPAMINDLVRQWQQIKSGSLGLTSQTAGMEQEFGAPRGYNYIPGSGPITQPQYFGLPQPNFPQNFPGRYPVENPPQGGGPGGPGGYSNGNMNNTLSLNAWGEQKSPLLNVYGQPKSYAEQYTEKYGMPSQYGGQYPNAGTGRYVTGGSSSNVTNQWYPPPGGPTWPQNLPPNPPAANPGLYWPESNY